MANTWGAAPWNSGQWGDQADIDLSETKFDELCKLLMKDANRPVTVIMLLDLPLSINLAGDLLIETAAKLKILDLSWIIPLK